jgi:TolB-like protein/tetratricopeptide (TPR) repeat protein
MSGGSFFRELRKRKVVQAAAIYGAIAWGVTEVVVTVVEQLFLPQWVSTLAVIFFVVGFPVAMFLAWTFDITSEGIRRTTITSRRGTASIVGSLALLIVGTTGLFFLIKPSLEVREVARFEVLPVAPNSVAVLPFENVAGNPEDSYLVGGLSDALRDQLARVSGLRIAARVSSIAVLKQELDAVGIARNLGVAHLVDGSVRREGGVLTVSVQLIEGATGLAIWSDNFRRGPGELVTVQQTVAEAIVANVLPDSPEVAAVPATRDPTANELLLLARYHEQQVRDRPEVDVATLLEAIRLYREATEADPESALAHSRLAGALIYLGDIEAAEAPIYKALLINPRLSEVQHTLGLFHWANGEVREARADWQRAVELNPNNPKALQDLARARWYYEINSASVRELLQRAVDLDPLNLEPYRTLGAWFAIKNYPEEARELVARMQELFDGAAAFRAIADVYRLLGDFDKSIAWTIRARDLEPDYPLHVYRLAELYAEIGDFDTALELDPDGIAVLFHARRYQEMMDIAEYLVIDEPGDFRLRVTMANAYNALGQFELARFVLSPIGLPELVYEGFRTTAEWDGLIALMNSHYGAGNFEMARELARFALDYTDATMVRDVDWWWPLNTACADAILERDKEARNWMERLRNSTSLAWNPIVRDSPCFDRLADDPVYQATLQHYDELRAMLRERLPATLAEFGVEL